MALLGESPCAPAIFFGVVGRIHHHSILRGRTDHVSIGGAWSDNGVRIFCRGFKDPLNISSDALSSISLCISRCVGLVGQFERVSTSIYILGS